MLLQSNNVAKNDLEIFYCLDILPFYQTEIKNMGNFREVSILHLLNLEKTSIF